MSQEFELESVGFITIETIGPAGQRIFHLQAGQDDQLFTFLIEKEQASALADTVSEILDEISQKFSIRTPETVGGTYDFELREPILPLFRVGQMGLGYDSDKDQLILLLHELQVEDAGVEPHTARLGASREQMRALAIHSRNVIAGGRPICGNCGRPMDPEGHFCPKSNGHKRETSSA
jgi:uncharacterized repeat protein (TIGR03847 family)